MLSHQLHSEISCPVHFLFFHTNIYTYHNILSQEINSESEIRFILKVGFRVS